ncbi:fungal-specific transcription factor domain containing protein [Rhypophila decipiens]
MMDQLETQVSDLRSFLDPNATNPSAATAAAPAATGGGRSSVRPVPAPLPTPQPTQPPSFHASASVLSAPYGDNSAHDSMSPISPPPPHHYQQQQQQHHSHHSQHGPHYTNQGLASSSSGRASISSSLPNNNAATVKPTTSKRQASEAALSDDQDGAPGSSSGSKQQRAKRNRYISIACNECKRRKIKCNGQTPCQRCGHLNLQCLYAPNCCTNNFKDSDEYRQMNDQVGRLQEQVDALFNSLNALRQETVRLAPILPLPSSSSAASTPTLSVPSIPPLPKPVTTLRVPPSFSGPTSIAFTVDVAKNTLHNMGYTGNDGSEGDNGNNNNEPTPQASPSIQPLGGRSSSTTTMTNSPTTPDPLWTFTRDEMIQLCQFHEEEVGIMYPVIKIEYIIEHAKKLSSWMESTKRHGLASPQNGGQDGGISDHTTLILKIVMCCALTVMEHGKSTRAEQLYDSIQPIVDKMLMSDPADVTKLPFLALVAGYRFLGNEEILAWRVMGHVARLCFELGLHRREGLERIPDAQDRRNAVNTFWSAYVLDRRWGFGTGLPFVCHDDKIDPGLPMPDDYPYLVAMISYSRLGAKIWKLVDYFEPALIRDLKPHDVEALDREILDWYETVPESIKVPSLDPEQIPMPSGPKYDLQRLQVWTRLRLNQIRTWLHTPVLHSASSIAENMYLAQKTVGFAKETIRYLAQLHKTTSIYHRIQTFYHQFLTSAISVLFLASTHAPLTFSADCRGEFYMALDLVKGMSSKSWVSQRLWKTIRSLKAYAPRLGLEEDTRGRSFRTGGGGQGSYATTTTMTGGGVYSTSPALPPGMSAIGTGVGGLGTGGFSLTGAAGYHGDGRVNTNLGYQHQQQHQQDGMSGSNVSTPSPASMGNNSQQQHQQQQLQQASTQWITNDNNSNSNEDLSNGMRLQSEMSRIYEGFTGIDVLPSLQTLQRSQIFHSTAGAGQGADMVGRGSHTSPPGPGPGGQQEYGIGTAAAGMSPADGGGGGGGSSSSVGVASPASNGSGGVGVYSVMRDIVF